MKKILFLAAAMLASGCVKNVDNPKIGQPESFSDTLEVRSSSLYAHFDSFPGFLSTLEETDCELPGPDGEIMPLKDFLRQGRQDPKAVAYVESRLSVLEKQDTAALSPLELAVKAVDAMRADISRTDGKGKYTKEHEREKYKKIVLNYRMGGKRVVEEITHKFGRDSTQGLGQFIGHPGGLYEGDCDDFSTALLTSYEIMKDLAKAKEGEFYSRLSKGLRRYQVIGLNVEGHAMNASLTYGEDFSKAKVQIIEPQIFDFTKDDGVESIFILESGGLGAVSAVFRDSTNGSAIIWRIYNSNTCYEMPEKLKDRFMR